MRWEPVTSSTGLTYIITGKGKPLLFFHGFGATIQGFSPLIEELAKTHMVLFPVIYSGPSQLRDWGSTILALLDELNIQQPISIMGYSMGCVPAICSVIDSPQRFERLIIIDGLLHHGIATYLTASAQLSMSLINHILRIPDAHRTTTLVTDFVRTAWAYPASMLHHVIACSQHQTIEQLPAVSIPTLILWGKSDRVTPPSQAYQVHEKMKGSRLEMVEGDHLWGILHPEQCADILNKISSSD